MSIASVASGIAVTCCVIIAAAVAPRALAAELFPWHPVFMTVGFLGFMHQGIMKAYRLRSSDGTVRVAGLQAHLWIQLVAVSCTLLGFLIIYLNKVRTKLK
jgi:cytochrome b-561 domain-containing protein 2